MSEVKRGGNSLLVAEPDTLVGHRFVKRRGDGTHRSLLRSRDAN